MRILMVLYNRTGKGTYWRALQLARALTAYGHQVTILSTAPRRRLSFARQEDRIQGVELIESPTLLGGPLSYGWDPYDILARLIWLTGRDFDLVYGFESRPAVIIPALAWRKRRRGPLLLDWCDWFGRGGSVEQRPNFLIRSLLRPLETFFEERFRSRADGATVINRFLAARAVRTGVDPRRILLLANGSDVETFVPIPLAQARRELGWAQETPVVGYVGALFHQDAMLMAAAFNLIRQEMPRARLLLAGYCNVAVEEMVDEPDAVERTGPLTLPMVNRYLAACNVCWLPLVDSGANRGRFPLKVNDYLSIGRPVVATDVGEIGELLRRGPCGLVTFPHPAALAKGVLALLRDEERQLRWAQRARYLAESELLWEHQGQRLEHFLVDLAAEFRQA